MFFVDVAKIQYHTLDEGNKPRFFQTFKNFTKVASVAASGDFLNKIKPTSFTYPNFCMTFRKKLCFSEKKSLS